MAVSLHSAHARTIRFKFIKHNVTILVGNLRGTYHNILFHITGIHWKTERRYIE